MKKELIAHQDPKSPVSEIFRTLRTNIQFMNSNKKLKTLLVTSTLPGEGKSWVASNLSVAFAQAGKRVVLIDADMRKGRLYNIFGVLPRPGLSNYLSGVSENSFEKNNLINYLRETEVPNLYLMPAGNIPPNPSELLITPQMVNLLEELKQECDLIIIDGTPSKLVTDAVILSRIVDSTIVVTAHNQTKKDELEKVIRDIKNVGGNVVGVVYNKIPISSKKYNATYYYASVPQKSQVRSKTENENEQKKETQRSKVTQTNQINKDIKQEKYKTPIETEEMELPKAIKKDFVEKVLTTPVRQETEGQPIREKIKIQQEPEIAKEKTPEERTAEVLREFNEYLKKEKRNKNNG